MSQERIKTLLDKINLLFNVFMKDGLEKVSSLEKELLKEQILKLLQELDGLEVGKPLDLTQGKVQDEAQEQVVKTIMPEKSTSKEPDRAEVESVAEVSDEALPELEVAVEELAPKNEEQAMMVKEELLKPEKKDARVFSDNKPTRSLKEIIDLNKSFILKGELFDNNNEAYNTFITSLNALQSEEESIKFVEATAKSLSWDTEEKAYELLIRAVEKRFLPLLQQ